MKQAMLGISTALISMPKTNEQLPKLSEEQRTEIAKMLYAIATCLDLKVGPDRIDLYLQSLSDVDFDPLRGAITQLLRTSKWFPKIAEIRETAEQWRTAAEHAQREADRHLAAALNWKPEHEWGTPPTANNWRLRDKNSFRLLAVSEGGQWRKPNQIDFARFGEYSAGPDKK